MSLSLPSLRWDALGTPAVDCSLTFISRDRPARHLEAEGLGQCFGSLEKGASAVDFRAQGRVRNAWHHWRPRGEAIPYQLSARALDVPPVSHTIH